MPFVNCGKRLLANPDVFLDVGRQGWLVVGWQQFLDRRLLGADEWGEEATFREKLMDHDRADRVVGLEVEQGVRDGPPDLRKSLASTAA